MVMEVLLQAVVDELRTVVAIEGSQREGKALFDLDQCGFNADRELAPDAGALKSNLRSCRWCDVGLVGVQKNSPAMVAPQWATVSPSQLPGRSTSWWCVRTGTRLRSHSVAGVVPESPRRPSASALRVGASSRSMLAAEIGLTNRRVCRLRRTPCSAS